MKILMMVMNLNVGGTEMYVLSLAKALLKMGHAVGIVTKGGPLAENFRRSGVRVHIVQRGAKRREMAQKVREVIYKGQYQLVHAHDSDWFSVIGGYASLIPVPKVITIHGKYHLVPILKRVFPRVNSIIVVSPSIYSWVLRHGARKYKISLIPNGIDVDLYSPRKNGYGRKPNALIAAYVGRFSGVKAHVARKVIIASDLVSKQYKNFEIHMKGIGLSRSQLIRVATRINSRQRRRIVHFEPVVQSVQNTYVKADLVIGAGRVAMEAMASGKPVIAAGVAGYHGIVTPASLQSAIYSNFGDHFAKRLTKPEILAKDIKYLLHRPKLIRTLGEFGRKAIITRFAIQRVARKIHMVYLKASK